MSVCCPRSFRVPSPSPRSMATVCLVQPGCHPRNSTSDAYSLFMRPSCNHQSSKGRVTLSLSQPAATPIHPSHGGKFIKASKGESSALSTVSTGPSSPIATTSPKTETRKRKNCKSAKCTVTSKTVSPPEKRKKVISESPDSQAEGPFYNTDTISVPEDSPPAL